MLYHIAASTPVSIDCWNSIKTRLTIMHLFTGNKLPAAGPGRAAVAAGVVAGRLPRRLAALPPPPLARPLAAAAAARRPAGTASASPYCQLWKLDSRWGEKFGILALQDSKATCGTSCRWFLIFFMTSTQTEVKATLHVQCLEVS